VLYFINPLLLILFMGSGRIVYRWWKEHRQFNLLREQGKPVLVMGAGDGARRLLSELERSATWQVIGMLDDNRGKVGREIAGYTVLGSWDEVANVAQRTSARHVIFATPGASAAARRRAFELCERAGLHLLIVPELDQIISGTHRISELREIELDDLLGRAPVKLDTKGLSQLIGNQTVLITGAGGSIGSELCRQIARFAPRSLVLYELSEYALYQVVEDLQRLYPAITVWAVVGDVKDRQVLHALGDLSAYARRPQAGRRLCRWAVRRQRVLRGLRGGQVRRVTSRRLDNYSRGGFVVASCYIEFFT
jgi:FlaA1/EpsC-like NDP-sugar epimerase